MVPAAQYILTPTVSPTLTSHACAGTRGRPCSPDGPLLDLERENWSLGTRAFRRRSHSFSLPPRRHDRNGDEVIGAAREVGGDDRTRSGPAPHPLLARTTSLSAPTDAPQFVEQRTSGGGRRMPARGEGKSSGARNASLEIANDRAKDARWEKAWPQRTGPILTERRKL
jgi:hypothetical protein